jgi:hypothetical protein
MQFEHSSRNYRNTADKLIAHIKAEIEESEGRTEWTRVNLKTLRSFPIDGLKLSWYPAPDDSKRSRMKGQFLWDHMSCTDDDVILIAESEWNKDLIELKHDFEKLLYTRCPIKLMMCGGWSDSAEIADALGTYAKDNCHNFGPGEVFVLFCVGWVEGGKRVHDDVFRWQVPGEVCRNDGRKFSFQSDWE